MKFDTKFAEFETKTAEFVTKVNEFNIKTVVFGTKINEFDTKIVEFVNKIVEFVNKIVGFVNKGLPLLVNATIFVGTRLWRVRFNSPSANSFGFCLWQKQNTPQSVLLQQINNFYTFELVIGYQANYCMYKKQKQYRLYNFDYSQDGHYFITIVTKDREHFFGKIVNKEMIYSPIGEYVKNNILKFYVDEKLENPYKNNIYFINNKPTLIGITEWSVLPNHIHLIIEIINKVQKEYTGITGLSPLSKGSVSSFANHFKGHIKKWCTENNFIDFNWQSRFHDRVIRNAAEYDQIAWYIQNNVLNWDTDDLHL